jgi:hypothetical protein
VATRLIESRWRCFGDVDIASMNPKNPFGSDDFPPSYIDYQVASILIQRVLIPLREKVLQEEDGTTR